MKGWKTKLGGILAGLVPVIPMFGMPTHIAEPVQHIVGGLAALFVAIGIGHKIDKNTAAKTS